MMTLYVTLRSPFARKVRIVLFEKGLPHVLEVVDLAARPAAFSAATPIGKVPLLMHEGLVIPDSTVICEYLEDRHPERPMYGAGWEGRLQSRILDELGDTLSDQAVAAFFARQRGDDLVLTRALGVAGRVLDDLERRLTVDEWPAAFEVGSASVVSACGYFGFRHGEGWRAGRPALAAWFDAMSERVSVRETVPVG